MGRSQRHHRPTSQGTPAAQLVKLEEVSELELAWTENDKGEMIDAIGDCTVVLILLSELLDLKYEYCVETAYEVIALRKGAMVNGQFVKEAK